MIELGWKKYTGNLGNLGFECEFDREFFRFKYGIGGDPSSNTPELTIQEISWVIPEGLLRCNQNSVLCTERVRGRNVLG